MSTHYGLCQFFGDWALLQLPLIGCQPSTHHSEHSDHSSNQCPRGNLVGSGSLWQRRGQGYSLEGTSEGAFEGTIDGLSLGAHDWVLEGFVVVGAFFFLESFFLAFFLDFLPPLVADLGFVTRNLLLLLFFLAAFFAIRSTNNGFSKDVSQVDDDERSCGWRCSAFSAVREADEKAVRVASATKKRVVTLKGICFLSLQCLRSQIVRGSFPPLISSQVACDMFVCRRFSETSPSRKLVFLFCQVHVMAPSSRVRSSSHFRFCVNNMR